LSLVAGGLYIASAVLEYFIYPQHLYSFMVIRAVIASYILLLFPISYIKRFQPYASLFTKSGMIVAGAGIAYMIRVLGYEDPYYAGLNLIYLGVMLVPWGFRNTLAVCAVVYSFYLIPILVFDLNGIELSPFVNNNVFQLETILIALVVNHFQSRRRRNEIVNRLTIAQQAKELEETDKYKREFIANITHELKTPLAIVMGNADLILEQTDDEELRDGIYLIRRAAFQLANHVDRIIAVATVDDPDAKPDLGNYDYCGVVQNASTMFEARAREENITYALNVSPGPLVVNIDVVRVEEVLSNLIQNAFKFTPPHGLITVTVGTDGETVFTEISDSGVGIPEDQIDKIFDRMYQADEVLSKRHSGIGLGLYISKKNVELNGGEISVHSKQGKGTSFRFSLPLHLDQSALVKNQPWDGRDRRATPRRTGQDRRQQPDRRSAERRKAFEYQQRMGLDELARMTYADNVREYESQNPALPTILILEDNAGMMKVIVEALREQYNLLLAFDAFEALRKLETHASEVALILSDIMMPGMSGLDFCKKIMSQEAYQHIPLIFITALMNQEDQLKGYDVGATDYIVKPYNIKILKEKVDHWISRRQYELLLKGASDTLEQRVTQLSRIKDIILHEIRNPIQIIEGANYFIGKLHSDAIDDATEEEKLMWGNVRQLGQGINALTSVLKTTQQLDLDELQLKLPESLAEVVQEALLQTRHLLGSVVLDCNIADFKSLTVDCDRRMLVQVLVNLIRNGIDAIGEANRETEGRVEIYTELADEQNILLKITDNGIGMEPKVVNQLFRFKFTTKKDGNGIGLHFSKMILKLHEGSIQVESEKGMGTTFVIHLPISKTQLTQTA
ncbi:MAG: response regulator, partial [Proteobacteria bacterium]|nr:response regulator [Pseudomonadota bacterium]